jgi:hypothetical protein
VVSRDQYASFETPNYLKFALFKKINPPLQLYMRLTKKLKKSKSKSINCIIPYSTVIKGVLNIIYPFQMGSSASMVRLQPRHRHQKDTLVYRGSHPCLERKLRYYRIAITAHLAVISSFLPFCQQSSPYTSVNFKRVHSGQSSLAK